MLFRFRQAQAIEMGVEKAPTDRRPRMASSVSSLKDCEKWRGEIMREISRKVSKIQDAGLTDYEIRDLNDEINKLLREKSHFERQIIALGGANYRRARQAMVDEEGREVPGTRGYKYFGRAKDLPGVKELFQRGAIQETEDAARFSSFQKFRDNGDDYYGNVDEVDPELVKEEEEMEVEDWDAAFARIAEQLTLPEDATPPPVPAKAPAPEQIPGEDVEMGDGSAKQSQTSFFGVLDQESMQWPQQPTKAEMEKILLDVRKKALLAEYGV
ncbi:NineTeen Complex (NTC) component [Naganishia albida]|nr:NineTeen Complex (NTC) component [Naganishia albida]